MFSIIYIWLSSSISYFFENYFSFFFNFFLIFFFFLFYICVSINSSSHSRFNNKNDSFTTWTSILFSWIYFLYNYRIKSLVSTPIWLFVSIIFQNSKILIDNFYNSLFFSSNIYRIIVLELKSSFLLMLKANLWFIYSFYSSCSNFVKGIFFNESLSIEYISYKAFSLSSKKLLIPIKISLIY